MTLRVGPALEFEGDLATLPALPRNEMWRVLARLRKRPLSPGPGYSLNELRRSSRPGVRVARFWHDQYRLMFEVDGELLILVGVGKRPGFYRRLDRLRARRRTSDSGPS